MTEFDELIKQKAASKKFTYSAKAWRSFSKKAGIKAALTATQSVVIGVASVAVLTVGGYFGYKHFHTETPQVEPTEIIPSNEEEIIVALEDTIEIIEESAPSLEEEPIMDVTPSRERAISEEKPAPTAAIDTVAKEEKPKKAPILRPKNPTRILEIRTDTIKSNY